VSLFGGKRGEDGEAAPGPALAPGAEAGRSEGSRLLGRGSSGDAPHSRGETVAHIGKSIVIKGDLSGDEDLEIDGQVEGRVQLPNHELTIGAHGQMKAELNAKSVVVVGHVTGNVNASERVEVQATGVVDGDIRAPRLTIQEGAVVNGAVEMTPSQGGAQKPAPQAAAKAG